MEPRRTLICNLQFSLGEILKKVVVCQWEIIFINPVAKICIFYLETTKMDRFDVPLEMLTSANPVELADSRQKELHFDREMGCLLDSQCLV